MDTEFVELHKPCPVCNSSDACSINEDGSAKCFSCDEFFPDYYKATGEVKPMTTATVTNIKKQKQKVLEVPKNGIFTRIEHRNISEKTARKYGVKVVQHGNEIGDQIFPYYADNQLVATKIKYKKDDHDKHFRTTGFINESGLFGEQLFKSGGKYLTIVEGEYDALAAYQMSVLNKEFKVLFVI